MTTLSLTASPRTDEPIVAPRSYYAEVLVRLAGDPAALVSLGLVLLFVVAALGAPLLAPHDPLRASVTERLRPIGTPGHTLGTDEQGRDVLSRLMHGGRLSLLTGLIPVLVATTVGTAVGAGAAYLGGIRGTVLMRVIDVSYAFPAVLLAIAIAASLGSSVSSVIVALSIVFVPPIARVAESATRQVAVQEYVEAARLAGASWPEVVVFQVLPNIVGQVFVYASGLVGLSIVIASGLSFLGLGAAPPTPEWGAMLNGLRASVYVQPVVVALPGLAIFLTSVACNVLSDSLSDALDVRRL